MFFKLDNFAENTAIITENESFTYKQLKTFSELIAEQIDSRSLVFILADNNIESVAGYVGFINHKIVPMMIDSKLDSDFVNNLLHLYQPKFLWLPSESAENYSTYKKIFEFKNYSLLKTESDVELFDKLALLMTTSGSTGSPKFVRLSYENIDANTKSIIEYLQIQPSDRSITNLPMNYVYGLSIINTHLYIGASIVLTTYTLFQKEFWQMFKTHEVTNFNGVPYTFEMLQMLRFFKMDLPSLKFITQAGGKLSPQLHKRFAEYAETTGKKFVVMYGAAEATARMGYLPAELSLKKIGCMGVAIPQGRFELIDDQNQIINAVDVTGELIYYGKNVCLGYAENKNDLRRGDELNQRLQTGDFAKIDEDGFYTIVGRKKRFLKMFGKRINLQEVENIISEHFQIYNVAATGVDDKLYIFTSDKIDEHELMHYISSKLNLHHSALTIQIIEQIPKNSSGKTIYTELEKFYNV